jgi:glycosyltransferase involved in cell wall biosynthesis
MKLAFFSPLNPLRSGISDYSEELLPALAQGAEIDLFVDGFTPSNEEIAARFRVFDYRQEPASLERLKTYDALLCHMGNSHRCHSGIYEVAWQNPAVIVFHDFALQHFFLERASELRSPQIYLDEVEASIGSKAREEAEEALSRGAAPTYYHNPVAFPLNRRLANKAEGLIAHSEWSRARLAAIAPGVPTAKINMHVDASATEPHTPTPAPGQLSIASFGFITASKGLECALRALAALKPDHDFHYYLVGESDNYFNVQRLATLYGIQDCVSITGYVTFEEFKQRISQTDIAINLRDQTVGETSASLCRLMAAGVPTMVSNIGWYGELPDDCVVKIDQGPEADLLLCAYLKELVENRDLRTRIGNNARLHMRASHRADQTAAAYLSFIRHVVRGRGRRKFVDSVAGDVASLSNGEPEELLLGSVATEVTELLK